MVQPPVIGGDRGVWGQKLLDWIQDITGDAVSQATVDALSAQVSGKLENTPEEVEAAVASYGGPTGPEWAAVEAAVGRVDPGVSPDDADQLSWHDGVPVLLRWREIDATHPRWGVTQDGTSDDTEPLQAALDEAGAAASGIRGAVVTLHKGTALVNSRVEIPNSVTLLGVGERGTRIKAGPSFPTSTAVVRLGAEASAAEHGMFLEGVWVDCSSVAGSIGVESRTIQEPGGLRRVVITDYLQHGVNIYESGGNLPSHPVMDGVELFAAAALAGASIRLYTVTNTVSMRQVTINSNPGVTPASSVALLINGATVVADGLHIEHHEVGVDVYKGSGNRGSFVGLGLTGNPSVNTLVRFTGNAPVSLLGPIPNGAPVTVEDVDNGVSRYVEWDYSNAINYGNVVEFTNSTSGYNLTLTTYFLGDIYRIIPADGDCTVNLPASSGDTAGRTITIIHAGSADLVAATCPGEDLKGGWERQQITTPGGSLTLTNDGVSWGTVGSYGTIVDVP